MKTETSLLTVNNLRIGHRKCQRISLCSSVSADTSKVDPNLLIQKATDSCPILGSLFIPALAVQSSLPFTLLFISLDISL